MDNSSTINDACFNWYRDVVFIHGTLDLCKKYLNKYPMRLRLDDKYFVGICLKVIVTKRFDLFESIIEIKMNTQTEIHVRGIWKLTKTLIIRYVNTEKSAKNQQLVSLFGEKYSNDLHLLNIAFSKLIKVVTAKLLNSIYLTEESQNIQDTKSVREYAIEKGIENTEFLKMLE